MQVCTVACGKTAVIGSGKPFRPSTTAINTSSTPRFFRSFITRSQEFGAFILLEPEAENFLGAVGAHAERDMHRRVADEPFIADLDPQRIEENQWVNRLRRSRLPGGDLIQHSVGDRANEVGRDLDAVEIAQMADDLARAHTAGV